MTQARHLTVYSDRPGFYHCMTRCVRQAFLFDATGPCTQARSDRRHWIERRLFELCESFAVGLYAWAAMSNHCHVVILVDPLEPQKWSDEECAERWCRISQFPGRKVAPDKRRRREQALLRDAGRLRDIRARLGSLSWFMRFLNEGIARRANAEDGCTGHFWGGRFKSQNLLDDRAALAAMTYVDLNPIRAGAARTLSDCVFTSLPWRLRKLEEKGGAKRTPLGPIAGRVRKPAPTLPTQDYLRLVAWTGHHQHPSHKGRLKTSADGLTGPRAESEWWLKAAGTLETAFASFVGTPGTLARMARRMGRRWLRGGRHSTRSLDST